jgi:hypothetical protein
MSDELRKAALVVVNMWGAPASEPGNLSDAIEALRAALAEPEPKKCDCTGFGHNPACPVSLANLAATISRRHDATEPSREPTQEQVDAWRKQASDQASTDAYKYNDAASHSKHYWDTYAYQLAALAYAAGPKAGSGT